MTDATVLCVDPDATERERTADALREAGFAVREAGSVAAAGDALGGVDCVVTEYGLPDGTGLALVERAREVVPDAACVVFTDAAVDEIETEDPRTVAEFLRKGDPGARELLVGLVEHATAARTQTAYPLPDDETPRLEALAAYTPVPERVAASLNRLTTLAAALFDLRMAAVGLIDEHEERFLACYGTELGTIPREDTVCTYAMLEDDVTVVEDTREDPRFADNLYLEEVDIRFYASANLRTPDGEVIGAFCVFDDEPRTFDATDRDHLQRFADEAMEQLELRRRLHEVRPGDEDPAAVEPLVGAAGGDADE